MPGNTSDEKGGDLLIGETVRMKRVIADPGLGYDANRIRAVLLEQGTIPLIPPVGATENVRSNMTKAVTKIAGVSRPCSAASRASAASLPAMTSSSETFSQP